MNAVTWFGHSSVVVEVDGARFVTDPLLRRRVAHLVRAADVPRSALGRLDGILVSHTHYDHLHFASIGLFDRKIPVVVPRQAGKMLRRRGFEDVREVEPGQSLELGGVRIDVSPAEHGAVRRLVRAGSPALGFVVRGSTAVYFAGDTDLFDGMRDLRPVDTALLPVAGWGPRLPAGHLDPEGAARALLLLEPKTAVPIHWGTYRRLYARPSVDDPAGAFRAAAAALAPQVEVRIPALAEPIYV